MPLDINCTRPSLRLRLDPEAPKLHEEFRKGEPHNSTRGSLCHSFHLNSISIFLRVFCACGQ